MFGFVASTTTAAPDTAEPITAPDRFLMFDEYSFVIFWYTYHMVHKQHIDIQVHTCAEATAVYARTTTLV